MGLRPALVRLQWARRDRLPLQRQRRIEARAPRPEHRCARASRAALHDAGQSSGERCQSFDVCKLGHVGGTSAGGRPEHAGSRGREGRQRDAHQPRYFSVPRAIEYPTEQGKTAHAFYYPPRNEDYEPPEGEKPPLIVHVHGGPTGNAGQVYAFEFEYWTSRGFALVDVNYGGSAGYGRAYRHRLHGNWGVVDVDDCINAARYLAEKGFVDEHRIEITGGSAG